MCLWFVCVFCVCCVLCVVCVVVWALCLLFVVCVQYNVEQCVFPFFFGGGVFVCVCCVVCALGVGFLVSVSLVCVCCVCLCVVCFVCCGLCVVACFCLFVQSNGSTWLVFSEKMVRVCAVVFFFLCVVWLSGLCVTCVLCCYIYIVVRVYRTC